MKYKFLKDYLIVTKDEPESEWFKGLEKLNNTSRRWYCIFWAINKRGYKKICACTAWSKSEIWKLVVDVFEGKAKKPWGKWGTQEVIPALVIPKEWEKWIKFEKKFTKKSVKKYTDIFKRTIVWPTHYKK